MSDNLKVAEECGIKQRHNDPSELWCYRHELEAYTSRILASQQAAHDAEIAKLKESLQLQFKAATQAMEYGDELESQLSAANAACAMKDVALKAAMEICDLVPTSAHEYLANSNLRGIGHLVNQSDGCRGYYAIIREALSASPQQVSEWERKQLEPLRAQVALLVTALNAAWSEDFHLHHHYCTQLRDKALSNTQATADQFIAECEQRGAVKALEELYDFHGEADWYGKIKEMIESIRATSKKAG